MICFLLEGHPMPPPPRHFRFRWAFLLQINPAVRRPTLQNRPPYVLYIRLQKNISAKIFNYLFRKGSGEVPHAVW